MGIVQDEIFGPVLTLQTFTCEAEAVGLANDSIYGLSAPVFTRDLDVALQMSLALESGTVWVNDWAKLHDQFEEGGFKASGWAGCAGSPSSTTSSSTSTSACSRAPSPTSDSGSGPSNRSAQLHPTSQTGHLTMTTAIIGVGKIGTAVATDLVSGGEAVILAARTRADAERLAGELGPTATAAEVADAVRDADAVVFAVWLDATKDLITELGSQLDGKVVIDPSNPVAADDNGDLSRTLPDGVSSASVLAGLLTPGASLVKAFGTLSAPSLSSGANRTPERAVLFYATDATDAVATIERLISAAGFDPVGVGGLDQAIRIEMFGDLHEYGGLDGKLVDADEAAAALLKGSAQPALG